METLGHFGDFRIFAEIHRSPTTLVYKGYEPKKERPVLLKVLRPEVVEDPEISERFVSEAHLAARIDHPNVAVIYDAGRDDAGHYLVSEFIEGQSLREIIAARRIPWQIALYILQKTALGISAAHSRGILHRDIKPSNILVSNSGEIKLVDFGMSGLAQSILRKAQEVTGTLGFIAPEIILGKPAGKTTDVFSLGATFFEMLTARPAFPYDNDRNYFETVVNGEPQWANLGHLKVPDIIITLCKKMLARNPEDRYPDCDSLLADLKRTTGELRLKMEPAYLVAFLLDPEQFDPDAMLRKTESGRTSPRKVPLVLSGSVTAALLIVLFFFVLSSGNSPENESAATDGLIDSTQTKNIPGTPVFPTDHSEATLKPVMDRQPDEIPVALDSENEATAPETKEVETVPAPSQVLLNGWLSIRCTPWATVYVDGDSIGQTPMTDSLSLSAGRHQIRFVNPDFPAQNRTVMIEANQTLRYEFSFWTSVGSLNLDINPWAVVYIDGDSVDTVPPQSHPFVVTPGSHTLMLRHPAFGEWQTEIEFFAGEEKTLTFDLETLLKPE